MSGDFVKQLQLAKQLEMKAKEAAKGRETAEAKIQDATALLIKLKEMSASAVETEKLLTLASQSYSDKDYKEALSYAAKSTEAAARSRKDRLREMLRESNALLERVAVLGKPDEETLHALTVPGRTIDEGDLDGAYQQCKEAWDQAERNANRVVSDAFGLAQSSLLLAERLEMKVDKQKVSLRNCREALESGDVVKSVELIQALLGTLKSMTLDSFVQRIQMTELLLSMEKRFPMDLAEPRGKVTKARELIAGARVEEAFNTLDEADDSFSRAFSIATGALLIGILARTEDLTAHKKKVDLNDLEGKVRGLEKAKKFTEVVDLLNSARERVRAAEKEALLRELSRVQPRLKLAHMVRKDVSPAIQSMEEARKALKDDRFADAYRMTIDAWNLVEERLQGYDEVEDHLRVSQDLRSRCEDLGLACAEGVKFMGGAKRLTLQGDFVQAVEALSRSQRAFKLTLENHFATGIMRLEMRIATAMRLGAEVSEESALLEDLTSRVRKGDFELVHGSLITIGSTVEERTAAVVAEELKRTEDILSRYTSSPEAAGAGKLLSEAKERLHKKEYQAAHDQAKTVMTGLMAERRKNLDRSMQDGHDLLDMAKQLGAESVTLRERLQRAEELKAFGRVDEASLLVEEVISYGRSIVSSEIDQQLTELMQQITAARKEGVEVGQAEHLTEQGSVALHKDDLGTAFDLTMEARSSLNEVVTVHLRLTENLKEKQDLLEEAKRANVDVAEAQEAVLSGGKLLRSGRYAEAAQQLDRAQEALRRNASSFILSSKQKQLEEMAQLRDRLGFADSGKRVKQMGTLDAGDLDASLNALGQLREEWEKEISTKLDQELVSCQKSIDKAVKAGSSVGHVQQILAKGRSSLKDRKLLDAMRAVELVRAELDNAVQADRRLNDALALIEESLEQLKEMKAEVRDVTVLLEQSRALRRTGQSSSSADLAQRALDRCQSLARERVTSLMGFAGGLTPERANWEDLRTARKMNDDIEEALKNHRYRHAHLLARSFREELERVLQDKAQAEEEMRKFEQKLKEETKLGLRPESSQKALEKAKTLMAQGRFVQALSSVSVARDELRSLSEMYESRLNEYNTLRESLNSMEVLDPRKDRIEELLDQSWSALKEMHFESASLYLRRAKNALSEFLTVRTNELLWEFNPLHDLIKRLKLQKKFSAEIAEIERMNMDSVTARDLNKLSRSLDLVRAGMKDVFEEQREKARRLIEKASRADKQTGRSWELWSESETQAAKGDLWEAFNSLESAVNSVGRKGGDTPEALSKQLADMLEVANRNRVELQGTEKAYGEALALMNEGKSAITLLRKACEISRKEVRATYPDITAELQFVGEVVEGKQLDVIVHLKNEAAFEARKVRAFIFGDVEVKGMVEAESLKAGQETKGRITIIPNRAGILSLGISVKCKPLLTEEDVLYDSKFDLDVK